MKRRIGMFSIETVHEMVRGEVTTVLVRGIPVKVTSRRLKVFATKGVRCVTCQRVGTFYVVEKPKGNSGFHLHLYTDCGRMMTQDHILPASKGGKDGLDNLQPMCARCNRDKGSNEDFHPGR